MNLSSALTLFTTLSSTASAVDGPPTIWELEKSRNLRAGGNNNNNNIFLKGPPNPKKVDVCHYQEDEGVWKKISISKNALPSHLKNHDDAEPGDFTSLTVTALDDDCVVQEPSAQPSSQPSIQPLSRPSSQPSNQPSGQPSSQPSSQPSAQPSIQPSSQPSTQPSSQPSSQPSTQPSSQPSSKPSSQPSGQPSSQPSRSSQPSICGAPASCKGVPQKVYWTDRNGGQLWKTDLSTGTSTVLWDIKTEAGKNIRLQDVDLDSSTGTLYIADWGVSGPAAKYEGRILSIETSGINKSTVLTGLDAYHYLDLDPINQKIYYTQGVSYTSGASMDVGKVDYDGTNQIVLRDGDPQSGWFPSGIAVDVDGSKVYWGAPGIIPKPFGQVNVVDTDGFNAAQLAPWVSLHGRGLALDVCNDLIFLTSHDRISIQNSPVELATQGGLLLYNVASGGAVTDLINDPTTAYTDVEIEYGRQRVWWADFGRQQIKSAAYDDLGALSDIQVEADLPGKPFGIALDCALSSELG